LWGALLRSSIAAGASLKTAISTLSGLRNFTGLALYFRECSSYEFTIHLLLTSKKSTTVFARSNASGPGALGVSLLIENQRLSQAAAIRGEEQNITRYGESYKE
jgi:hypothetical protein